MKTNCWLVLVAMLATSAIADDNMNAQPETTPAPAVAPTAESTAVPAPPAKHKKKHTSAPSAALKEPTVALVPGPAEVRVSNLIVRGQAGHRGEVIAHLPRGETVTVLSQINLRRHAPDEPSRWAKIACPTNVQVWVVAKFIDATNRTVLPKKLNLRAGPGENYSVIGVLERGAAVSEIITKDDWMEIEPPASAYAFVAAMYLKQEAAAPVETPAPPPVQPAPAPTPPPTPAPEPQPAAVEKTNAPVVIPPNPPPAPEPVAAQTNRRPPPPRIATHEGVVRHAGSLIAPTAFVLYDPATDVNVDFLHTTTTNLDLSRYVGMRIIVTGEEGLAKRWQDIPVLTIQRIQVLDTNAVPKIIYRSPRAAGQRH